MLKEGDMCEVSHVKWRSVCFHLQPLTMLIRFWWWLSHECTHLTWNWSRRVLSCGHRSHHGRICMMHKKNSCAWWCTLHGSVIWCNVLSISASERIRTAGMWCDFPPGQCITPLLATLIHKASCKPESGYAGTLPYSWVCPHTLYWSRQYPERMIWISASRLGCPM